MKKIVLQAMRTYATEANADRAVQRVLGALQAPDGTELRYFVHRDAEGRYFPVFLGEKALQSGVHFHFPVVM